jgi:iron(III) transport system substrate-binding protein
MEETMMGLMRTIKALAVGAAASVVLCQMAAAADAVDAAAAKQEGKVAWYTSTPIETANKLAKMFEGQTGIKVEMFRSGGSAILSRFQQEMQAGRVAVDVLTTSDPAAANGMARKGTFVAFKPAGFEKVPDEAKDPTGAHIAQRLNMMTLFVRTDKMSLQNGPKTWSDAVDPKYKGQMVMTDPSFTSLQLTVIASLSKKFGWEYYEKLRKNDIMIVQGNQQVSDMMKRGERIIAVGALDSYAADDRKAGHPIATVYPTEGSFIIPSPTSIVKGSPNPNAAKLFAEFMVSEPAQKLFPEDGGYAARTDVPPPEGGPKLADVKTLPVDYDQVEKDTPAIKKKFNEIFQ